MSVAPRELLFYGGGECLSRFGTLVWRPNHAMDRAPTFTRAAAALFVDKNGVSRNAAANRLRIEWSGGEPGLLLEALKGEAFSVPCAVAQEPLTLYTSIEERGNSGTAGVVQIGTLTGATDPRLALAMVSSTYRGLWNAGSGLTTTPAPSVAPSVSDVIELMVTVAADGSVRFGQSINGATPEFEVTAGSAPSGGLLGSVIHLNATGTTNVGLGLFRAVKLARGVHGFDAMRGVFPRAAS